MTEIKKTRGGTSTAPKAKKKKSLQELVPETDFAPSGTNTEDDPTAESLQNPVSQTALAPPGMIPEDDPTVDSSDIDPAGSDPDKENLVLVSEQKPVILIACDNRLTELLQLAWLKAIDAEFVVIDTGCAMSDILIEGILTKDLPEDIIFVPGNIFPTSTVTRADLEIVKAFYNDRGERNFNTTLPMALNKEALTETLQMCEPDELDEKFFPLYHQVKYPGGKPLEISINGRFAGYAKREKPRPEAIRKALVERKFLVVSNAAIDAVKEILSEFYDS